MPPVFRLIGLIALAGALATSPVHALSTSAPQAVYQPAPWLKAALVEDLATTPGSGRRVVLGTPSPAERTAPAAGRAVAAGTGARPAAAPLRIGFPRVLPEAERSIALETLEWTPAGEGLRAARVEIASSGAQGVRVAVVPSGVPDGVALRFRGSAATATTMRVDVAEIASSVSRLGGYWSPVLEGDVATIEIVVPVSARLAGASIAFPRVSHLMVAGEALGRVTAARVEDIGDAASCNVDFACVSASPALVSAANAVGKLVASTPDGSTVLCTGTLLNDGVTSFTPYLFSASHCIGSAFLANTVNVYWFFRAVSCNSLQTPSYVLQTGGAALLARSEAYDWALLQLYQMPPAGVSYAAWRAEPLPLGAIGTTLHHPMGDLLQFSQGSYLGYTFSEDGTSSYHTMSWSQGITEIGSSGAALFTFLSSGNVYEVRGGLLGGQSSCARPRDADWFSRMDVMLPLVREYLTPTEPGIAGTAVAVEYYSPALDHYFVTSFDFEIEVLDSGAIPGWERTGLRFLVWSQPVAGANPVCRYYVKPEVGNSHFYSGDPGECAQVAIRFGNTWVLESPNVFYVMLPNPSTGACPQGTDPVWRFYSPSRLNHRYTTDAQVRLSLLVTPDWIAEGYGPDAVIMCTPVGG